MSRSKIETKPNNIELKKQHDQFEPRLIGFCCNWCSYAGADLAGLYRVKYPTNVRIIRTMCSSRVDPEFVINAFMTGVDGVLIAACHPGNCHYVSQNYKTIKRVALLIPLLETFGIDKERLRLEFISAGEGNKFAETIDDMVSLLKELGPSPLSKSKGDK
ncbi:MAG: hydrogenase iron-sulfur subunit [Candidatus Heimdallarchaeota archaeon]|nr:MAG: hydrogenase iron-sulfur subunit [Candidatus Heimdallarchaeota archaeon]